MGTSCLGGKGRRIRTVAVPLRAKQGNNAWMTAAGIEDGRLLQQVTKAGKPKGDGLRDWAVWSVVEQAAREIGSSGVENTICVGHVRSSAERQEAISNRSSSFWATRRSKLPSAISDQSKS